MPPTHIAAKDYELASKRFAVILREVVEPLVFPRSVALDASLALFQEIETPPPAPADAVKSRFKAIARGERWGPRWSTAWFKLKGSVPKDFAGPLALRFSCGTEALLWTPTKNGPWTPHQGLDVNRDAVHLTGALAPTPGSKVEFFIEAACNHPFGVSVFEWDGIDTWHRWNSEEPGRFERAELCTFDAQAWELRTAFAFAMQLMNELPATSPRGQQLHTTLRRVSVLVCDSSLEHRVRESLELLHAAIRVHAGASATRCTAVGHAHIDTAWLWPLRETRRKCLRTFSNVLRLMEREPGFVFLCSQAQQYAYIEQDSPELFAEIAARVREGRWEPGGGMWIETDANLVSGESLVRQILHGTSYWAKHFGNAAPQSFLFLPDTFGFPASLPQIMRKGGLSTFITNKLWWNQVNAFPHTTWRWRGIDGSEVLAHNTPGGDYNATNTPRELRKGETQHQNKDLVPLRSGREDDASETARWLQPFGFGDGGGGPTDWSIRFAEHASDCDGLPRVTMGRADTFCAQLHADQALLRAQGEDFPLWWGELYLEYHRGTFTTQAMVKRQNREAEESLRIAEMLTSTAPHMAAASDASHTTSPLSSSKPASQVPGKGAGKSGKLAPVSNTPGKLDKAWKTTLLNQFHDIIPGSSIAWVYEDAARDYEAVRRVIEPMVVKGIERIAQQFDASTLEARVAVLNPGSVSRSAVVEVDVGEEEPKLAFAKAVPALAVQVFDPARSAAFVPTRAIEIGAASGVTTPRLRTVELSNGILRAVINELGQVESLSRVGSPHDAAAFPLNQLVLYEDRPIMYDAWEIEQDYESRAQFVRTPADAFEVKSVPMRAQVRIERDLGLRSRIVQTFRLDAASPRLDIVTRVEWREERKLLRVLHATPLRAREATCGIQFGQITRPTHRNTSHEAAMFEWPAHGFVDLTTPHSFGVALLSDYKFGFSADADATVTDASGTALRHGGVTLGLSLLKSARTPDSTADLGEHEFTYSLMPHEGDWRAAGVHREAEALISPLRAVLLDDSAPHGPIALPAWAPMSLSTTGSAGVSISAVKASHAGDGRLIVRLYECQGGEGEAAIAWNLAVARVEAVDLLERPIVDPSLAPRVAHTAKPLTTRVSLKPYEIVTLAVTLL